MGDIGIDKWWWRMEEHKTKGHNLIEYGETINRKQVNKTGLFLKEQRVNFWKKNHRVPAHNELDLREADVEISNAEIAVMGN